jgi:hypothetical protein
VRIIGSAFASVISLSSMTAVRKENEVTVEGSKRSICKTVLYFHGCQQCNRAFPVNVPDVCLTVTYRRHGSIWVSSGLCSRSLHGPEGLGPAPNLVQTIADKLYVALFQIILFSQRKRESRLPVRPKLCMR